MEYKRTITDSIQRLAKQFPAIVVTGARQVGKTTLLRSVFPEHHYVSLDLPSLAEAAENEPESFLSSHPAPLIIDEVQYAPKIFRFLKSRIDESRHQMGRYILTGSQKFPLMKEVAESLAGRAAILELECLSLTEVGSQTDWVRILSRGMYPELWRQPHLRAGDFFSSYLATYLERDVRQILNVSNLRDFERLLRAAATRSGQLVNRTDLARDVGVSAKTVGEWLGVLQASNQLFFLEPFFENVGKRLIKSPKLYFHDTGLLCFLLGLDEESLSRSPLLGAIWETFVYSELRKQVHLPEKQSQTLWFYRDAQGREIDFLRVHHAHIDLFECKWAEQPDERWFKPLQETHQHLGGSRAHHPGKRILVCRTPTNYQKDGVQIVHPNFLP